MLYTYKYISFQAVPGNFLYDTSACSIMSMSWGWLSTFIMPCWGALYTVTPFGSKKKKPEKNERMTRLAMKLTKSCYDHTPNWPRPVDRKAANFRPQWHMTHSNRLSSDRCKHSGHGVRERRKPTPTSNPSKSPLTHVPKPQIVCVDFCFVQTSLNLRHPGLWTALGQAMAKGPNAPNRFFCTETAFTVCV